MDFWKWYFSGIWRVLKVLSPINIFRAFFNYVTALMLGIIIFVYGSIVLPFFTTPYYLLGTIPLGITLIAYYIWMNNKIKKGE